MLKNNMMKSSSTILLLVIFALFSDGCATWESRHGISIQEPAKIRIAVLPVRQNVKIKHLKNIATVPKGAGPVFKEDELILQKMREVLQNITLALDKELESTYFYEVVPLAEIQSAMNELNISDAKPITSDQVKALGKALNAPLVLATRLSGYGKIKKDWFVFLLASGVAEGAIDGAIVALGTSNPWIATGVALEEVVQEFVTWGGGFVLFDKIFTPVILESRLYGAIDGKIMWTKAEMARINKKGLKEYSKKERKDKELRLRLTSEMAVKKMADGLKKAAWANLKTP